MEAKILCLLEENYLALSYGGIPALGRSVREQERAEGAPEVTQG